MSQQPDKTTRILTQGLSDDTIHQPPAAMAALGGLGVFAGILTNLWQMYTTICAVYAMFTGGRVTRPPITLHDVTFNICLLIAFSFQFALLFLVFRIDIRWKRKQVSGGGEHRSGARNYGRAAVEVLQQLGLFGIWVGLAFVVDTLGDYTFIGDRTANADPATAVFLIFLYAVALYALSTLSFVRSIEYLWAAAAVKDHWQEARSRRRQASQVKW